MTWGEMGDMLNAEADALFSAGAIPLGRFARQPGLLAGALLEAEGHTKARLDRACERFARRRRWPRLTILERSMLVLRLEYAAGLCSLLGSEVPFYRGLIAQPSLDTPEEHVLRWVLEFAWHSEGFSQMHNTLERVQRGALPGTPLQDLDPGEPGR